MISKAPLLLIFIGIIAFLSIGCKPKAMVEGLLAKKEKKEEQEPKAGIFPYEKNTLPTGVSRAPKSSW